MKVDEDLRGEQAAKLLNQEVDLDKPGLGQFYCVHCAKHFVDAHAFNCHVKGKPHKRRMHALKTEPYTIEESQRAAGMGSYVAPKKRAMETMTPAGMGKSSEELTSAKKAKLSSLLEEEDQTMIPAQ